MTLKVHNEKSLQRLSKITEDHGRKPVGECLRLSKCLWSTTGVNPWVSIIEKLMEKGKMIRYQSFGF